MSDNPNAPIDPPVRRDVLEAELAYAAAHRDRAARAHDALLRVKDAHAELDEALKEAEAALRAKGTYDPSMPDLTEDRPFDPASLRIPRRVNSFVTRNAEEAMEAGVLIGAYAAAMGHHSDAVGDDWRLIREKLEAEPAGEQ